MSKLTPAKQATKLNTGEDKKKAYSITCADLSV